MSKEPKRARWFAAWRSPRRMPIGDDPADLGTAFGLDMSLDTVAPEPTPPAVVPRGSWMRRLAGRRRAAS